MTTADAVEQLLFNPRITLYWRGYFGKLAAAWYPDHKDRDLFHQFASEAGIHAYKLAEGQYDRFLTVASKYGYCVETIKKEDEE